MTAHICYNKECLLIACFKVNPGDYYNIQYLASWQNNPLVYTVDPIALTFIHSEPSLGRTYHLNPKYELVRGLGDALSGLEYVPEEMLALLENIIADKKDFQKNRDRFCEFYKYLTDSNVRE